MALDLFANFERSSNSSIFYRQCTPVGTEILEGISTHDWYIRVYDIAAPGLDISTRYEMSSSTGWYNPDKPITEDRYDEEGNFIEGNPHWEVSSTFYPNDDGLFVSPVTWDTTNPCVCAVRVTWKDIDTGTETTKTLSGVFVEESNWPRLDMIAWPAYQLSPKGDTLLKLTEVNALASSGLSFYGEGHTETISMRAISATTFSVDTKAFVEAYRPFDRRVSEALYETIDTIDWYIGRVPVTQTTFNNPGKATITDESRKVEPIEAISGGIGTANQKNITFLEALPTTITTGMYVQCSSASVINESSRISVISSDRKTIILDQNILGTITTEMVIYFNNVFVVNVKDGPDRFQSISVKLGDQALVGATTLILDQTVEEYNIAAPNKPLSLSSTKKIYPAGNKEFFINPEDPNFKNQNLTANSESFKIQDWVTIGSIFSDKINDEEAVFEGAPKLTTADGSNNSITLDKGLVNELMVVPHFVAHIYNDVEAGEFIVTDVFRSSSFPFRTEKIKVKYDPEYQKIYDQIVDTSTKIAVGTNHFTILNHTNDGWITIDSKPGTELEITKDNFVLDLGSQISIVSTGTIGTNMIYLNKQSPIFGDRTYLFAGQTISGPGIPSGTTIKSIKSNAITLSTSLTSTVGPSTIQIIGGSAIALASMPGNPTKAALGGQKSIYVDTANSYFSKIVVGDTFTNSGTTYKILKIETSTGLLELDKNIVSDIFIPVVSVGRDTAVTVISPTLEATKSILLDINDPNFKYVRKGVPFKFNTDTIGEITDVQIKTGKTSLSVPVGGNGKSQTATARIINKWETVTVPLIPDTTFAELTYVDPETPSINGTVKLSKTAYPQEDFIELLETVPDELGVGFKITGQGIRSNPPVYVKEINGRRLTLETEGGNIIYVNNSEIRQFPIQETIPVSVSQDIVSGTLNFTVSTTATNASGISIKNPITAGTLIESNTYFVNTTVKSYTTQNAESITGTVELNDSIKRIIFAKPFLKIDLSPQGYIAPGTLVSGVGISQGTTILAFDELNNKITIDKPITMKRSKGDVVNCNTDIDYKSWYRQEIRVRSNTNQDGTAVYPISMWATNKRLRPFGDTVKGPYLTYSDITGLPEYYPFFVSTVKPFGLPDTAPLRQNIEVLPYPVIPNASLISDTLSAERINLSLDFSSTPLSASVLFNPLQGSSFLNETYVQTAWSVTAFADFGGQTGKWTVSTGKQPETYTTNSTPVSGYSFNIAYERTPSELFLTTWNASPIVDTTLTVSVSAFKEIQFKTWRFRGPFSFELDYQAGDSVVVGEGQTAQYYYSLTNNNQNNDPNKQLTKWRVANFGVHVPIEYFDVEPKFVNDWQPKVVQVPLQIKTIIDQIPYTNIYLPNFYALKGHPTLITVGVWHPSVDKIKITSPGYADGEINLDVENPIWNFRGTWNKDTIYRQGDTTTYKDRTYLCILTMDVPRNLAGQEPDKDGTYWSIQNAGAVSAFYKGNLVFNKLGPIPLDVEATIKDRYTNNANVTTKFRLENMAEVVETFEDVADDIFFNRDLSTFALTYTEQPKIAPNEWVTAEIVNSITEKFYTTLTEIDLFTKKHVRKNNFYAWWGLEPTENFIPKLVWRDLECKNLYDDSIIQTTWETLTSSSSLSGQYTWNFNKCTDKEDPTCKGKWCLDWKWSSRSTGGAPEKISWQDTAEYGAFPKRWAYERCDRQTDPRSCIRDSWNVSTIDTETFPIYYARYIERCKFVSVGAFPFYDYLVSVYPTEIILHINDYEASKIDSVFQIDGYLPFQNIVAASYLDKTETASGTAMVAVVDQTIPRVAIYKASLKDKILEQIETWGLYGTISTSGMNSPTDIHLDDRGRVWICDAGNSCFKQYNIKGKLLRTIYISEFETNKPKSMCVDSDKRLHCLAGNNVYVFSEEGDLLFEYTGPNYVQEYRKINCSYNRKAIYLSHTRGVYKFYKTGARSYDILKDVKCADESFIEEFENISQDSQRNVYIACQDKVLKVPDLQKISEAKATLSDKFWKLEDLLIDKEEYVQSWVYLRNFHRLWDCIEILRNSLFYEELGCKSFTKPTYSKSDLIIGQNELVTNAVINRLSEQLWTNLQSLIKYFDPDCEN